MKKSGFNLLELLIVIIIIGVLAILLYPSFRPAKESALNNEARANLKLIQAAEKIYKLEYGEWLYDLTYGVPYINSMLKISLKQEDTRPWNYSITDTGSGANFNATASRVVSPSDYNRNWSINSSLEEPVCPSGWCK
ncbi:MAG: prepilin-type N-terminal cleavage/methylation domain-containing protein [Candidatus Omnitrophica bacterium]|nr:prepilin-type N-terminal cleavage/methylation domain-containing protein [Candidatus Omnitrophota bacterium]MDD5236224.1 prepilin-type N-terminal cleavage/methylation domain-containing protein [Candidatus Omnitrophota bacterium]MDD5611106.1 prepilin-type N-terminal cleavage/methylation domain-containing protein [Candidatus Omnitrophota bacterium]